MPASDDTTGILTSVLEKGETLAYLAGDIDRRIMQEYTADAAHWVCVRLEIWDTLKAVLTFVEALGDDRCWVRCEGE